VIVTVGLGAEEVGALDEWVDEDISAEASSTGGGTGLHARARAEALREEELQEVVVTLAERMAAGRDRLGHVRFQCRFCPQDFEGVSAFPGIQRHLTGVHRNYLEADDVSPLPPCANALRLTVAPH